MREPRPEAPLQAPRPASPFWSHAMPDANPNPFDEALLEAIGHLGAAITQMVPSDDEIICDHVRKAHAILTTARRFVPER